MLPTPFVDIERCRANTVDKALVIIEHGPPKRGNTRISVVDVDPADSTLTQQIQGRAGPAGIGFVIRTTGQIVKFEQIGQEGR